MAAYSVGGGRGVPTRQMHYKESGVTLGQSGRESACSSLVALDLSALISWKPKGQDVVPSGILMCSLSLSLPIALVSVIPLQGLATLPQGILLLLLSSF